jgi:ABC-type nitrate/sulfonate/bicarbonate transport system substrate-binding protein
MEKKSGRVSRRQVVKGGVALGVGIGLSAGLLAKPMVARAAGPKVRVLTTAGNFSLVQEVMFKELKLFEKYNVDADLQLVSDGSKINAALIGGDADICGASGFSGLFPAIEKGAKLKILAGSGLAPLTILYANNKFPNIKSVKDLPGHTVGTGAPGALLHELAVGVLKKYGVDYKTVNFVNIGSSADVFRAITAGTVDAGAAAIEYRDHADKYNMHPLVDGEFYKELPLYTNQAMYSVDRAIAEKRQGLVGVMAAYADLFRWIAKPGTKEDFTKYYRQAVGAKVSQEEIDFFQDFLSKPGRLATNLVLAPEAIKYVQDLNVELGVQKAVLPFKDVADMSLAEEALKLLKA